MYFLRNSYVRVTRELIYFTFLTRCVFAIFLFLVELKPGYHFMHQDNFSTWRNKLISAGRV